MKIDWVRAGRKVMCHFVLIAMVLEQLLELSEQMSAWKAVGRIL